jgi:hypothetical protein
MFEYLKDLPKAVGNTYCQEILLERNSAGLPIRCGASIPLGEVLCKDCKTRKENDENRLSCESPSM